MKKPIVMVAAALMAGLALAKERVFILVAHPDDTLACAGTMFLMKDKFELHVMVLTHGERGNGVQGFLDGSTKAKRTKEEENAEAMVGATVHWGNEIDGECYPRPATCQQVATLMKELKPRAVIGMWPLDRHLDHAMAGATLLKALGIAGMREVIECYFMEQSYDTRTFVPAHYVDITDVMEEKRAYIRQYVSQNKDDGMCKLEMADSYARAQRCSSWLLRGCPANGGAERFAVYDGKPQGCRCIFAELPPPKGWSSDWADAKPSKYTPEGGMKAASAAVAAGNTGIDDWKLRLPRPIFDEKPALVEFYDTAWEIAHTHIDNLPGIPVPRYMDEGHRSDWIWIWDTCFMAHFCKYAPWEFPGIDSLGNFYGILMPEGNFTLPKVRGNRWSCGPKGISEPWEGRMLDFKVHIPENPPLFAWTEYRHALLTGDRARLENVYRKKRYLQRWFEIYENFDPAAKPMFGTTAPVRSKKIGDLGYRWSGGASGMDNTPRGRKGEKDLSQVGMANCPKNPDLLWIDAYAQQALAALYISRIADLLNDKDGVRRWKEVYEAKKAKINELYWDEQDGFYYDILSGDLSKCKVPTIASYWALLAEIPNATQRQRLVEKLSDERWFGGSVPTPSLARKDADFCPEGGYWRGGVWLPTTYMTIKALDNCGETALARDIARKVVFSMYETWKNYEPHTIWECYSPTDAKPSSYKEKGHVRDNFCGWSALGPISLLIEDVIGIKEANAFTRTLTCDFSRDPVGRVGVENYRFGDVVCTIQATKADIKVQSNLPFELRADGRRLSVRPGMNVFDRPSVDKPEVTWSVMHPTELDPAYMARVAEKAVEYGGVDSFEVCGTCHSGMGGMDGLLLFEPYRRTFEKRDKAKVEALRSALRGVVREAHKVGKKLYYWHREGFLPDGILEDLPTLKDADGEIDLMGDAFYSYLRWRIAAAFDAVPEVDGYVLTLTEADFSVIHNSNAEKYPPAKVVERIARVFAEEHEKRGKRFTIRSFGSVARDYEDIIAGASAAAKDHCFEIETKATPYDFSPFLSNNRFLRKVPGSTLGIECDGIGEFLGAGYPPCAQVDQILRYVAAGRRADVDRYVIRIDRIGNSIFDSAQEINLYAYMRLIRGGANLSREALVAEWAGKRWKGCEREMSALVEKSFEMVSSMEFVDGNVTFHQHPVAPSFKFLKAGGVFATFREGADLHMAKRLWGLRAERRTPGRARILQEKDRAVALAREGLSVIEGLKGRLAPDEFSRQHRAWSCACKATVATREFFRCAAAYFDDMEVGRRDPVTLRTRQAEAERCISSLMNNPVAGVEGLNVKHSEAVGVDLDRVYFIPLRWLCREFLNEYAAEHRIRAGLASRDEVVDFMVPGGIYDDNRVDRPMHGSYPELVDGMPVRWIGNSIFPNGTVVVEFDAQSNDSVEVVLTPAGADEICLAVNGGEARPFKAKGGVVRVAVASQGKTQIEIAKKGKRHPGVVSVALIRKMSE